MLILQNQKMLCYLLAIDAHIGIIADISFVIVAIFHLWVEAAKNTHRIKKVSNKICWELNFVQKSPQVHMSISPRSGARGLKDVRSIILKENSKLHLI